MWVLVLLFPTWFKLRLLNHVGFKLVISYLVQVKIFEPSMLYTYYSLLGSTLELSTKCVLDFPYLVEVKIFVPCRF